MNEIPRSLEYEEEQALDSQRVIPGGGDAFATVEYGDPDARSGSERFSSSCFRRIASVLRWPRLALEQIKAARARRRAWRRLFPPGQERQLEKLSIEERADARRAADLVADSHRVYFSAFNSLTAEAQENFEKRAWIQAA